jgi:hypothetical protein
MPVPEREGGFIVLHRRLLSSAVWGLPATQRQVWVELLFAANWRDTEAYVSGKSVTVPRGSALITGRTLAARAGVSRGVVERAMRAFHALGMVTFTDLGPGARGGTTVRLVNVLNYRKYQDVPEDEAGQPQDQPRDQPRDNPGADQNKGTKKQENKKETTPPEAALPEGTDWSGLLAAMSKAWATKYDGKKLVLLGKDFKPLRSLVCSLTDVEVWRRWEIYLANDDKFYTGHPVALFCSQVNRFVVAPASDRFREPWEGASPVSPQDWEKMQ